MSGTIVIAVDGTKSSVITVTSTSRSTINGTINQNTVQIVVNGKKSHVAISNAVARFVSKFTGIISMTIASPVKAGTKRIVKTHTVAGQFEYTLPGQTSQNTALARVSTPQNVQTPNVVKM